MKLPAGKTCRARRIVPSLLIAIGLALIVISGVWAVLAARHSAPEPFKRLLYALTSHHPDLDAIEILKRAFEAPEKVNYRAHKTVELWAPDGGRRTLRILITHRRPSSTRIEYLSNTGDPGKGRIIIQHKGKTQVYDPGHGKLVTTTLPEGFTRLAPIEDFDLFSRNYKATLVRTTSHSVLGRKCHQIRIEPRHPGNPSLQLWVDASTYVLLRSEQSGPDNRPLAREYLTQVSFPKTIPASEVTLRVPPGTKKVNLDAPRRYDSLADLSKELGYEVTLPIEPPPGYVFAHASRYFKDKETTHITYTNGLNTLSLFQRPSPDKDPRAGKRSGLERLVLMRSGIQSTVSWEASGFQYTLIGNVDFNSFEQIARSLDPSRSRAILGRVGRTYPHARGEPIQFLTSRGMGAKDVVRIVVTSHKSGLEPKKVYFRLSSGRHDWTKLLRELGLDPTQIEELVRKVVSGTGP